MDARTIVDLVLAVLVVETAVLAVLGRRLRTLPRFRDLSPNLAAGLFLVLALRSAVHGAGAIPIGLFVALGGVAHVVDLVRRSKSGASRP